MTSADLARQAEEAVLACQQLFWLALERKDADLLTQALADDFVCRSPGQADQYRAAFITTITGMPLTVVNVRAEQVAIQVFDTVAVLTGTQVAQLKLPNGSQAGECLALSNVFRQANGQWQMVLAHPVALPNEA
jgi:ketosteroid isomerase-like protein